LVIRAGGRVEIIDVPPGHGLGGRSSPRPAERSTVLEPGDRLLMCSDGVIEGGTGQAGLGLDGCADAALLSDRGSAADTVRKVHGAALEASDQRLQDDATVVCLAVE
jgi:serine phosphatase RsbU (regulator of sigma subunit)